MIKELALRWPLMRQIANRTDGTGVDAMSERTLTLLPKNKGARAFVPERLGQLRAAYSLQAAQEG
jgi:hypothetical protein